MFPNIPQQFPCSLKVNGDVPLFPKSYFEEILHEVLLSNSDSEQVVKPSVVSFFISFAKLKKANITDNI